MGLLNQLLQIVGTSPALIIGLAGLVFLISRSTNPHIRWFLFSFCCFAASLGEYRDAYVLESPPLAFPLQQLRAYDRPLTVLVLALLILISLRTVRGWRQQHLPQPLQMLLALQSLLFIKGFIEGSLLFASLSIVIYCGVVFMVMRGPHHWLQDDRDFRLGIRAIALVSVIFMGACLYQASVDLYPITFTQGLLLGTTGNPQHAAVLLSATFPCFLFFVLQPNQNNWQHVFWLILLLANLFTLLLTGSRTGMLCVFVVIVLFMSRRIGWPSTLGLLALLGVVFLPMFLDRAATNSFVADTILPSKLTSLSDTRTHVWQAQWRNFTEYPFFGRPLTGDRLRFGENSWLAVASATGIAGLIPAILFAYQCCKFIWKLHCLGKAYPAYRLHCEVVIAGLVSLLAGSITEAYLLGIITFPLFAICAYLIFGQYLLDVSALIKAHTIALNRKLLLSSPSIQQV